MNALTDELAGGFIGLDPGIAVKPVKTFKENTTFYRGFICVLTFSDAHS